VRIAPLTEPQEAVALAALFMEIWQTGFQHAPVSPDLLCAFAFTGQYVVTARRGDAIVGGSVGFLARDGAGPHLHSHITGVHPSEQGHQVGLALKLHQRAWAAEQGLVAIAWTFDPLVRRNAYFNLTKLGATAARYKVDAYGEMADGVNAGDPSDRCVARWPVAAAPARATDPDLRGADVVLRCDPDGGPVAAPPAGAATRLAWVPEDIVVLRREQPELALRWRLALREAFVAALRDGFAATAMTRDGWYRLERTR
jgi:predicted GNAT superfamily acetyltransferase